MVDRPQGGFPGLYATTFAGSTFVEQPFIGRTSMGVLLQLPSQAHTLHHTDDDHFVSSTQWGSYTAVVVVHLPSGEVARASPDDGGCWSLLSLHHGATEGVFGSSMRMVQHTQLVWRTWSTWRPLQCARFMRSLTVLSSLLCCAC